MTEASAQRVCMQALTIFGDQVEAQTILYGQKTNYHAQIYHKRLRRRISLGREQHWPEVKDAWLAATGE